MRERECGSPRGAGESAGRGRPAGRWRHGPGRSWSAYAGEYTADLYRQTVQFACRICVDAKRPLQVDRAVERHAGGAVLDAGCVDHADRDAGHLPRHQARSTGPGEQLLPAVDDPRLHGRRERPGGELGAAGGHVRPGAHLHPRLRDLHGRVADADHRLDDRPARGDLSDRLPDRPGSRWRLSARQRCGDHHRRVPGQPARHGPRGQQHHGGRGHVHRPGARRACWRRSTGGWCS